MADSSLSEIVAPAKKRISVVWDYFGVEKDKEDSIICRSCRRSVTAKNGNTSNLLAHLKTNHASIYQECRQAMEQKAIANATQESKKSKACSTQPTLMETITRCQPYEKKGKRYAELTNAVTYCIAKDSLPIHTVERTGFKAMLRAFDSRYEIPSRNYFSRTALPSLYSSTKEKVTAEIQQVRFFSATTDMWSSIGLKPYMSYTIHFIDKEWTLQSRCLQAQFFPESHTGENIAEAMLNALDSWNLKVENQVCLTTDNGSNIVKAARDLGWCRLSCFGHNLRLAVTKALNSDQRCTRVLGVCRKIVSAFSQSWNRKQELTKAQLNLHINQKSLVADCPTRWGPMDKMVGQILEQKEAIRLALSADRSASHLIPTWQDVDVLESIDKALNPLHELTDILSGEQYVTVSAIRPMVELIKTKILWIETNDTDLTKSLKRQINEDLGQCYKDEAVTRLLDITSVLDPRFKIKYLEKADEVLALVKEEGANIVRAVQEKRITQTTNDADGVITSEPTRKKKKLGTLFKAYEDEHDVEEARQISPEQVFNTELDNYLSLPKLDAEEEILPWWKLYNSKYPFVSQLAQKYLSICATSSASERLFSTSGNVVTPSRSSLKPDKVNMLTFLAKNL